MLRCVFLASLLACNVFGATLAVSTYFRDNISPVAIASDSAGNIIVAGNVSLDPESPGTSMAVAKFDPKAQQYLYFAILDSPTTGTVSALAADASGNAYVAGVTTNPNFPAIGGSQLGTPPKTTMDQRAFVTKLNPNGAVMFSALLGGSTPAVPQGIAIAPQGQILVSGLASATGFPTTPGAYSVPDSNGHWFLMELDPTASKLIFSATGIGGSAIAFDASGNIYLAGSSAGTDYPTTPGAYQTAFVQGHICYGLCQIGFDGNLQHVSKVDPAGSELIYSTGLNDTTGAAGSTTATGLAVDAAGNAYVTGTLFEAQYPFTVPTPSNYYGYLTKLNSTGTAVAFSIPVGGGGVQLDASGSVFVGGALSSYNPVGLGGSVTPLAPPPPFSGIPQPCWPDNITAISEAFVMQIDPQTGSITDGQWIDGSAPLPTGITLAGGKTWITGSTPGADVPITPGALSAQSVQPGFVLGAFLAAVDFTTSPGSGPAIGCVLDAGNLTHVGPVAAFQLISLFGQNLGPDPGQLAPNGSATSLAGVTVTFDGQPAQLLYVSSSQINVAVPAPLPSQQVVPLPTSTVMEVTVNGMTIQRQFPFTASNLNIFADLSSNEVACPSANQIENGFQPVALNSDGSFNSCQNPAAFGSTVSFFVHGIGAIQLGFPPPQNLFDLEAIVGNCSAIVENAALVTGFVYKVDVLLPSTLLPCAQDYSLTSPENPFSVFLSSGGTFMGPRIVPAPSGPIINFSPGQPMPMVIWVSN